MITKLKFVIWLVLSSSPICTGFDGTAHGSAACWLDCRFLLHHDLLSFSALGTYKGNCISNWSLMTNSASTLYTATDVSVK